MEGIAQLVRATVCGTVGRGFETHYSPILFQFFILISLLPYCIYFILITTIIGWLLFNLFIYFIFNPKKPISLFGFKIQGYFPRKKNYFIEKITQFIYTQLTETNWSKIICSEENMQKLNPIIESNIDHFIRIKLAQELPIIATFIGESTILKLKTIFMNELTILLPNIIDNQIVTLSSNKANLKDKINAYIFTFYNNEIEKKFLNKNQFTLKKIQFMGIFFVFLISVIQVIIMLILIYTI